MLPALLLFLIAVFFALTFFAVRPARSHKPEADEYEDSYWLRKNEEKFRKSEIGDRKDGTSPQSAVRSPQC